MKKIAFCLIVAFLIIGIGHYFINPEAKFVSDFIYNIDVAYYLDEVSKIDFLHEASIKSLRFLSESISSNIEIFNDLKISVPYKDDSGGVSLEDVELITAKNVSEFFSVLSRRFKQFFKDGAIEFWNSVVDFLSFMSNGLYFLFYGTSFLLEFIFSLLTSFIKLLSIFIKLVFGYSI